MEKSAMLDSKKFKAAVLASLVALGGKYLGMGIDEIAVITGPFYAFIGAQGLADFAKERTASSVVNVANVAPPKEKIE